MLPDMIDASHDELISQLRKGRVIPLLGSGVSTAVANIPGWADVLRHGASHLASMGSASEDEVAAIRKLITDADFVAAAQQLGRLLGAPAGEYPCWLESLFGIDRDRIIRPHLLHQIVNLLCPVIATTNFDRLITMLHFDSPAPVTWKTPVQMLRGLRDGGCVLHLHGVYDAPETVIFGIEDYGLLVNEPSYRTILKTLWLDRTLLFIGCSFDGLQDPDFASLLTWASDEFKGSPYKHYALLRTGTFGVREAARWLNDWRIQVIGYGARFEDLPRAIERINPNMDRARAIRVLRAKELLDSGDPAGKSALLDLLRGIEKAGSAIDMNRIADDLLSSSRQSAMQWRSNLSSLQELAKIFVDPELVRAELLDWKYHRPLAEQSPRFLSTVLAAAEALFLFPHDVLAGLHRRGVGVHERVLDGYCREVVANARDRTHYIDEYSTENLKRVLETLDYVLAADSTRVFPDPLTGSATSQDLSAAFVVIRTDRLEIRPTDTPQNIAAILPTEPPGLSDATVETLGGRRVIVAFNNEQVFAWDPKGPTSSIASFRVAEAYGINSATHHQAGGQLRTILSTTDGTIYELTDFVRTNSIRVPRDMGFVGDVILSPDGRIFAFAGLSGPIVEIRGKDFVPILEESDLKRLVSEFPLAQASVGGADCKWRGIRRMAFGGSVHLVINIAIGDEDSIIIIVTPRGDSVEAVGAAYVRGGRVFDYSVVYGADETLRMVMALKSDFRESYDLVRWSRGARTSRGLIFVHEGSVGRAYHDMVHVIATERGEGLAGDTSGGLFSYSMGTKSFSEIHRDERSRIVGLALIEW